MGDFDIILTFKKKQNMMQAAKKCGELFSCDAKTPEAASSGVFLFVTVNHSAQAVAAYLSLSSHLHMQQLTTPATTETRNVMSNSTIRLTSFLLEVRQLLHHIIFFVSILLIFYSFLLYFVRFQISETLSQPSIATSATKKPAITHNPTSGNSKEL